VRRNKSVSRTTLTTVIMATLLATTATAHADAPKAGAMVDAKYVEIQQIIATDKDDRSVRAKIVKVLGSFTDFREFGRLTIKKHWPNLTPAQRDLFVERYRLLIHKSYVKHFKANQKLVVSRRGEPEFRKGKARVKTTVKSGDTEAYVDYKLHLKDGGFMAYDIVIDDVSLMRNYRKQFGRILNKDGFEKLIEKIDAKINKPEDDDDSL
jgi:phospholipid transport system substrate-binding protein